MITDSMTGSTMERSPAGLLYLLQLSSSALPVGAYSYSEGLETLAQAGQLTDAQALTHWLQQEMTCGAVRLELVAAYRAYGALAAGDLDGLRYWNQWLSAVRETEELRQQSWQMGRALVRLLQSLEPAMQPSLQACGEPINFAIAFSVAAVHWRIESTAALLGYLHSWATNLVNAGVKLIPLGQTDGQKSLRNLYPTLQSCVDEIQTVSEDAIASCGWGMAIASMNHETLYSRLFRS